MKSIIVKVIIPLTLLSLWFVLTLKYVSENEFGLTSLVSLFKLENLSFSRSPNLLRGDIAKGKFTSQYPKLGTISVRFSNHDRINSDRIEFRLKEKSSKDWYYRATINTDQFQKGELFPFGFPPIENSVGKKYVFEIESISGTSDDSVSVDPVFPTIVSHHIYSKKDLLGSPGEVLYFLRQKFIFLITQQIFLYQSLIFALPLIFYLLIVILQVKPKIIFILLFLLMIYDVVQHTVVSDFMYISMITIWLIIFFKFRLNSDILKPQIVFLFLLMTFSATANQIAMTEKAATWLYLSLAVRLTRFILKK